MTEPLMQRTVVIGNSGSGKRTLAEDIANLAHIPAIDLDLLHWEEGSYGANLRIVMSSIMRRRNGLIASSVMEVLLS